jgi:RimJ/RimL family protein N-acetyltransferase
MVLIETERLFIRQWVPDDWKRFRPLGTDPRVLEYLVTEPWSDERIQRFINKGIEVAKTRGWILWPVIHREDAELIGFCGFGDEFPPDVEIGWRLRPEYWGRGIGGVDWRLRRRRRSCSMVSTHFTLNVSSP